MEENQLMISKYADDFSKEFGEKGSANYSTLPFEVVTRSGKFFRYILDAWTNKFTGIKTAHFFICTIFIYFFELTT